MQLTRNHTLAEGVAIASEGMGLPISPALLTSAVESLTSGSGAKAISQAGDALSKATNPVRGLQDALSALQPLQGGAIGMEMSKMSFGVVGDLKNMTAELGIMLCNNETLKRLLEDGRSSMLPQLTELYDSVGDATTAVKTSLKFAPALLASTALEVKEVMVMLFDLVPANMLRYVSLDAEAGFHKLNTTLIRFTDTWIAGLQFWWRARHRSWEASCLTRSRW